jgi:hypothetical protein
MFRSVQIDRHTLLLFAYCYLFPIPLFYGPFYNIPLQPPRLSEFLIVMCVICSYIRFSTLLTKGRNYQYKVTLSHISPHEEIFSAKTKVQIRALLIH